MSHNYLIIGGGGIQAAAIIHYLLTRDSDSNITLMDANSGSMMKMVDRFPEFRHRLATVNRPVTDVESMVDIMRIHDVVIGSARYALNVTLTKAAIQAGVHFCDLGGNNTVVRQQHSLSQEASDAGSKILPDCGVAPGSASVLASHALYMTPGAERLRLFCGGLPQKPEGPLKYAMFFDPSGLVNEYHELCEIIRNGKRCQVEPLTEIEWIRFPGAGSLIAANTSGGVSTMVETFDGKLREMSYKTLRYPGEPGQLDHWQMMVTYRNTGWFDDTQRLTIHGERTSQRRVFEDVLRQTLPVNVPDVLYLMVVCESPTKRTTLSVIDRMDSVTGLSAMQRTTGYSAAICARMLATGEISETGTLKHELHVPAVRFIDEWTNYGIKVEVSSASI